MYETLKKRYEMGFCTKEQLYRYVTLGKLTQAEYEGIIGADDAAKIEQ